MFLCSYFGWQFSEFVQGRTSLRNTWFLSHFYDKVTDSDWCSAQSLLDIMNIREGSSVLTFSDDSSFSASELSFIICSDELCGLALVFLPLVFIFVCTLCTIFIINK